MTIQYVLYRVSLVFFIIIAGLVPQDGVASKRFTAEVVKVIDGDSLLVTTGGKDIELRLYGIDCPEYDQPFSDRAKSYVKRLILKRSVEIEGYYKDSYGRLVALVFLDGRCLNHELIRAGLAWYYPRYCKKNFCRGWKASEERAREAGLHLWSRPAIAPWRWKHRKK